MNYETRKRIVAAIVALEDGQEIEQYGPQVCAIFMGVDPFDFREVDDEIGNAHPRYQGKGWMVRCVRNSNVWGARLQLALEGFSYEAPLKGYAKLNELPAYVNFVAGGNDKPIEIKWSGKQAPPAIGDTVKSRIVGKGTVVAYFVEHGWLGVLVKPSRAPAWYTKQNGKGCPAHTFGIELA